VRPFLRGSCTAGRHTPLFTFSGDKKAVGRLARDCRRSLRSLPIRDYGLPKGRAVTGRSTLFSVRTLQSRPLSFSFSTPWDTVAFINLQRPFRTILSQLSTSQPHSSLRDQHRPWKAWPAALSLYADDPGFNWPEGIDLARKQKKDRSARDCRHVWIYQDTKRPFHARLSPFFPFSWPFRARPSPFSTFSEQEKVISRGAFAIFNLFKT